MYMYMYINPPLSLSPPFMYIHSVRFDGGVQGRGGGSRGEDAAYGGHEGKQREPGMYVYKFVHAHIHTHVYIYT
jgi:hypothetical protein